MSCKFRDWPKGWYAMRLIDCETQTGTVPTPRSVALPTG